MRRAVVGLTALALALGPEAGSIGCGRGDAASGPPGEDGPRPPVVEVVEVSPRPLANRAELLGQLQASESVMIRSEVAGVIESVEFAQGEAVEAGELLFRLRDDEQVARLHEAQAELRTAEDTHRRTRELASSQVVAEVQLERAAAELEAARARVEVAQVALDRATIRAPFEGIAGARLVSPGARIEPETDLVTVDAIAELELVFTLPEQVLPLARVGVPVEISVAPYPGERFPGEIFFVAPSLNPQNRRLLVKGRVPNADLRLRPGLFAKVHAEVGEREDAIVLPEGAVVYGGEGSFVWRLDTADAAEQAPVEVGLRRQGRVEILSGLAAGDRVVVAGTNKLSPGTVVEAVPAPAEVMEPGPLAPAPGDAPDAFGGEPGSEAGERAG